MIVYIKCIHCGFKITRDMKHVFSSEICPACGKKISMESVSSVMLLLDTIIELNLPLSANDIKKFINKFLKEKLDLKFPDIVIEDELKDRLNVASKINVSHKEKNIDNDMNSTTDKESVYITETEVNEIKKEIDEGSKPIVSLPDVKEFSKEGIIFLDPSNYTSGKEPIIHKDLSNIKREKK